MGSGLKSNINGNTKKGDKYIYVTSYTIDFQIHLLKEQRDEREKMNLVTEKTYQVLELILQELHIDSEHICGERRDQRDSGLCQHQKCMPN